MMRLGATTDDGWGRRGRAQLAGGLLLLLLLTGCGGGTTSQPRPTAATQHPGSATSTGAPSGPLKPVLRGLLDRKGAPPPAFDSSLAGYVVNADWSELQPDQQGPIAANNSIDQAVQEVRAINAKNHLNLGLKLRISAGIRAPDWAKELGGDPIPVTNPSSGVTGTIGRFWTDAFGQAYATLQSQLAAKYDAVPEIREVTISRCTTVYDEPFIREISSPETVSALLVAGYTSDLDRACQHQQIDAHRVWKQTSSDLALNPYQEIGGGGATSTDEDFTEVMMGYCRQSLGAACVLENNSLRAIPNSPLYARMYRAIQSLGPNIAFQTATLKRVGSLQVTLSNAVRYGAGSVELPGGYEAMSPSTFSAVRMSLASNPAT